MSQKHIGFKKEIPLDEQKDLQLKILQSLDSFCKKENIRYYAAYGTLIGAIRHSGYIPWDDDVDIFMFRSDYEKFIENYHDDIYKLATPQKKGYPFLFSKIYDGRTISFEKNVVESISGVYIDIFPLDSLPENDCDRIKFLRKLSFFYFLMNVKIRCRMKRKNVLKTICSDILFLLLKFISVETLKKRINNTIKNCICKKSNYVGSICIWTYLKKEKYPIDWFGCPVNVGFENITIPIPQKFGEILTQLYGDYMCLPPVEKRINSHGCSCYWI